MTNPGLVQMPISREIQQARLEAKIQESRRREAELRSRIKSMAFEAQLQADIDNFAVQTKKQFRKVQTAEPEVQSEFEDIDQNSGLGRGILDGRILVDEQEMVRKGKRKCGRQNTQTSK